MRQGNAKLSGRGDLGCTLVVSRPTAIVERRALEGLKDWEAWGACIAGEVSIHSSFFYRGWIS